MTKILQYLGLLIWLLIPISVSGQWTQQLVQDTLTIHLNKTTVSPLEHFIVDVQDLRETDPHVFIIDEVKKWSVVPIDRLVLTKPAIADYITQLSQAGPDPQDSIRIRIHTLQYHAFGGLICPRYQMNSIIEVQTKRPALGYQTTGWFYHESVLGKSLFKNNFEKQLPWLIEQWGRMLLTDVDQLSNNVNTQILNGRFSVQPVSDKPLEFTSMGIIGFGLKDFIADIHVNVSPILSQKWSRRSGGTFLRYRHGDVFESIQFALVNEQWISTWEPPQVQLVFRGLIGFNRWHDTDEVKHKLYDAMIFELSTQQKILWQWHQFWLGAGLFESVNYIYTKNWRIDGGVLLSIGVAL